MSAPTSAANAGGSVRANPPCANKAFAFTPIGQLAHRNAEYLVEGLLETDTLCAAFGDPGSGKSFLAMDMACSVATGTDFHGRAVRQGPVIYIAGEGLNGLRRRFEAWSLYHGVPINTAPCFISTRAAQFLEAESLKEVRQAMWQQATEHGKPALIVIDTVARNFGPGDENSNAEMGKFVAAMDALREPFPGSVVLLIHHSGHADKQRGRGAMALKGALDCEYRVEKKGKLVSLSNTKMKDAKTPLPITFSLEDVDIGPGASSAVLVGTETPAKVRGLTSTQKLAQDTYIAAATRSGRWNRYVYPGLEASEWRDFFYEAYVGGNPDAKRQAFGRVRKELLELDLLTVDHEIYLWKDDAVINAIKAAKAARAARRS